MADNNANTKPKRRYSARMWDVLHYKQTEQYTRAVDALFDAATKKIADAASKSAVDADKPFSFADYPAVKEVMQEVTNQLAVRVNKTIEAGARNEWNYACRKSDAFIASIMNTSKLPKSDLSEMQDRNLDALKTFQSRKVAGLNLSERVWNYVCQYREQMETALDVGLGEGRSAQQLARDVKQNLKDPNRLFRRVRDKRGNLVLSKAAKAFHPGQGVYRSSVKNAQRLTRSEINMAYRESDYLRWQQLDFVVGFEVFRSNHEPLCKCDICAKLVGRYPKTFKFVGWHPQCMCYAVPILRDYYSQDASDDRVNRFKAALYGTEYRKYTPKNTVTDVPDGFKAWVKDHIDAQKKWASTPYFIRDNFKNGILADGLKIALPKIPTIPPIPNVVEMELFKGNTPQEIKDFILQNIADSCTIEINPKDIGLWNDIVNQLNNRIQQFRLRRFSNVGVPRNRKAVASWDEHGNAINLNIAGLRNKTGMKAAMKYKERGSLYSFAYDDIDDYVRAVIDHEIGHVILSRYANMGDVANLMSIVGKSIEVNGKMFNPIDDVLGWYASTEEHEFFAEAFSYYMGKNRNNLDDRIKDYFGQLFDKKKFNLDLNKSRVETIPVNQPIDKPRVSDLMPDEFKAKSKYLHGEDYEFEKDFFDLIDPKKPIRLEIVDGNNGSYSIKGELVHIESSKRNNESPWQRKSVIYHEYGHCIDAQRELHKDPKLIAMRDAQIKILKKEKEYSLTVRKWKDGSGWYYEKEVKKMPFVEYIDKRLVQLAEKIVYMKEDSFKRFGITRADAIEQISATLDTVKSLVIKYGQGHSTAYFKSPNMQEKEYLAHAFENAFLGNRVFKKYMPDVYAEMVAYIKALKPIQ